MIAPNTLDGAHIYFPDPWHKKRHHKRRLIQAPFVKLLADRLKVGGYLHLATDWQDYAEQMLVVLNAEKTLSNSSLNNTYVTSYYDATNADTGNIATSAGNTYKFIGTT
jgi:tRNA (guanine-N7-)-methyltransferase